MTELDFLSAFDKNLFVAASSDYNIEFARINGTWYEHDLEWIDSSWDKLEDTEFFNLPSTWRSYQKTMRIATDKDIIQVLTSRLTQ